MQLFTDQYFFFKIVIDFFNFVLLHTHDVISTHAYTLTYKYRDTGVFHRHDCTQLSIALSTCC
jgi:hypothetical protein